MLGVNDIGFCRPCFSMRIFGLRRVGFPSVRYCDLVQFPTISFSFLRRLHAPSAHPPSFIVRSASTYRIEGYVIKEMANPVLCARGVEESKGRTKFSQSARIFSLCSFSEFLPIVLGKATLGKLPRQAAHGWKTPGLKKKPPLAPVTNGYLKITILVLAMVTLAMAALVYKSERELAADSPDRSGRPRRSHRLPEFSVQAAGGRKQVLAVPLGRALLRAQSLHHRTRRDQCPVFFGERCAARGD